MGLAAVGRFDFNSDSVVSFSVAVVVILSGVVVSGADVVVDIVVGVAGIGVVVGGVVAGGGVAMVPIFGCGMKLSVVKCWGIIKL